MSPVHPLTVRLLLFVLLPFFTLYTLSLEAVEDPGVGSSITLSEWRVAWGGRPRDPDVAPDGKVWFCGQAGNYLARFDPITETFTRFELPEGTHPHNLIIDEAGTVWYAGNQNAHIGALDPASGEIRQYPMPVGVTDPHTLIFGDPGEIWFTAQWSNVVAPLDTASGEIIVYPVPTPQARPYGLKRDGEGNVWVVLLGTHKLMKIQPDRLEVTEIVLPHADARPRRLEIDAQGDIWYADYDRGTLGRYRPDRSKFEEYPLSTQPHSRPYATARDHQGWIWVALTGETPNVLVAFDPAEGRIVYRLGVPSGGAVRHMIHHGQNLWFGVDTGYLARVSLPLIPSPPVGLPIKPPQ